MRGRKGFTLIEVLVVIAVIAILAGIMFPVFSQVREKGRQVMCLSNQKQIGMALRMYQQDYDGRNMHSNDCDYWPVWVNSQLILGNYMRNFAVWRCPSDRGLSPVVNQQDPCFYRFFSYSFNRWMDGRLDGVIDNSAQHVVFFDGNEHDGGSEGNCDWPIVESEQDWPCWEVDPEYLPGFTRHSGGFIATYHDGHARWHRLNTLKRANFVPAADINRRFPWPSPGFP
jgi:prepilin-type N-terminal cleavage/methylation domain-containing protein